MEDKAEAGDQGDYVGLPLRLDQRAESASSDLPAFLARPAGAPVYHGFPIVPETETDGWVYGTISEFEDPDACEYGDGFVIAPDGTRAGIVWSVGTFPTKVLIGPESGRWGVFAIAFPRAVTNVEDIVICFRAVLPELRARHAEALARIRRPWWRRIFE